MKSEIPTTRIVALLGLTETQNMSEDKRYRPAIRLGLGAATIATITPFAFWHALRGEWIEVLVVAIVDVIALMITLNVLHNKELHQLVLITIGNLLTLYMVHRLGQVGIYWVYPVAVFNYFLLTPVAASIINAGVLVIALASASTWASSAEWLRLLPTLTATITFAAVFAFNITRQTQQLEALANCDPLTGAGNRRLLEQQVRIALGLQRRYGTPASLVLLDIDHFKSINDDYGHDRGDRVLIELVSVIKERLRGSDQLFRYGGEEFVILLMSSKATDALSLAEALRRRVEAVPIAGLMQLTLSASVVEMAVDDTRETWFKRADQALYRAKANGRNRVELTGTE